MIQTTGDIGTQWILDSCNGIVKEGCIPEDWKSSVVLPIYKGKGDPMECGSYRGIKLLEHAMKVVERIFENRIWQQIDIYDMQFGFMKGKGTTDAKRVKIGVHLPKLLQKQIWGSFFMGHPVESGWTTLSAGVRRTTRAEKFGLRSQKMETSNGHQRALVP